MCFGIKFAHQTNWHRISSHPSCTTARIKSGVIRLDNGGARGCCNAIFIIFRLSAMFSAGERTEAFSVCCGCEEFTFFSKFFVINNIEYSIDLCRIIHSSIHLSIHLLFIPQPLSPFLPFSPPYFAFSVPFQSDFRILFPSRTFAMQNSLRSPYCSEPLQWLNNFRYLFFSFFSIFCPFSPCMKLSKNPLCTAQCAIRSFTWHWPSHSLNSLILNLQYL